MQNPNLELVFCDMISNWLISLRAMNIIKNLLLLFSLNQF